MKYIKRLIALPFLLGLLIIPSVFWWFKAGYLFLLYGGEFISYHKQRNSKLIAQVFDELVVSRGSGCSCKQPTE